MDRPDLAALVAHYQQLLRLQDWRIEATYEKNLATSDGAAVWGLCRPIADAKIARIWIRDPATPPDGATSEEALRQITETMVHELTHLHFAAFGARSPAEVVAEEQAVWAIAEALVKAQGTPAEPQIARAMLAHVRHAAPGQARTGVRKMAVDKKLATEALDALTAGDTEKCAEILKAIIVGSLAGEAPAEEPIVVDATAEGEDEDLEGRVAARQVVGEHAALAKLCLELTGKRTPGEAAVELRRRNRLVAELEQREETLLRERAALDASERRELVATMVRRGHEPPATGWARTADGSPDANRPAEPWASMPLAVLRERVARLGAGTGQARMAPPATGGVADLTEAERAMLAKKKIDPEVYMKTKAAIAAKARATTARKGA